MKWKVHGERAVYRNRWISLWLVDVEQPDGNRFEHHVARMRSVSATVVLNSRNEVLMLWRHRFITQRWGWEIPMGLIEPGETAAEAAVREVEEETGWRPDSVRQILYAEPANGITDSEHHIFRSDSATYIGPPTEANESDRIEWVSLSKIKAMIDGGEIVSSATLVALLRVLLDEPDRFNSANGSGPPGDPGTR